MNTEFNKLVEAAKIFFSGAESGTYNHALALSNLTPETISARKEELDKLIEERRLMEYAKDTSKVATSEKTETRLAAEDMLAPIMVIAEQHFRGTEYETNLYLSRRYTNQPPGEDGEPRGRRLRQRSRAAHMRLARYNSILDTLENMPEEERTLFTHGGVNQEHLVKFRQRVAEFEDAHITRPKILQDYKAQSKDWQGRVKEFREWWKGACKLMKAHLRAAGYKEPKQILQALSMTRTR